MERFFNTAGPNVVEDSYTLDPLKRFDLDDILMLIRQKRYFVLYAPRQTGKTTCVLALRDYLNDADYIAVYANVEGGQASRNDVQSVVKSTIDTLAEQFRGVLKNDLPLEIRDIDILIDKLQEPRVKRVIEPMLANSDDADDGLIPIDDLQYVEDMGLIKRERGKPRRIANGIYREIIPRELT